MPYDPMTDKFPYPMETDHHYLKVKMDRGLVFDENYPYLDKTKKFKRKKSWLRVLLVSIVFPLTYVRLGLRVKGKQNLKKHKDIIDEGVISISNHVHLWDYLCINCGIRPIKPNVVVWAPNINGETGNLMRLVGGIPIPEHNIKGSMKFLDSVGELLNDGGWLQVYSEGSMWEYYAPIRPFKHGASYFANKFDKPIIPMAFSYRKPSWIRRVIFRQIAVFTLNIGEPLFVNKDLPEEEREKDLTIRSHDEVCRLAGIDPKKNIYPAVFNHSKRIDYYTDTYGKKYKGSH